MMSDVTIYEVGPRDGLQNEERIVDTATKVAFIDQLSQTGLKKIEVTSFVSPKWVPQMADSFDVMGSISRKSGVTYSALTPNLRGIEDAIAAGVDEVAIFAAASESFSEKNINCSIPQSMERFKPVVKVAKEHNLPVRGYVSCVTHCPYEGVINPVDVVRVSQILIDMGCYEISLGDTIGKAKPADIVVLLDAHSGRVPVERLALHCHDTYGRALSNIQTAYDRGVRTFDSSIAGLGGCPYAKGASGNVATEDVLKMFEELNVETNVNLEKIRKVASFISDQLA